MKLNDILVEAVNKGASDIHLKVGLPPVVRINKKIVPLGYLGRLTEETILYFLDKVVKTKTKRSELLQKGEVDLSYSIAGVSRFRVNVYKQRGTYAFAFRVLKTHIPSLDELMLPPQLKDIALANRGLILVTGPTGSGKSTTLASMIEYRNENKNNVIVTIEDPIEFVFKDRKSYIVQREIGADTLSFSSALRAALREDPDVIMVGEMRDIETIETALRAAETGHLVFSTLHTQDAKETITRIIDVFPIENQNHIRLLLSATLYAIISQRLIPRKDGEGVVPAVEILINEGAVREAIADREKFHDIRKLMEKGREQYGMQTFDQSILDLYNKGYISYEDTLAYASNPADLELKIKGISSSEDYGTGFFEDI
ncbi:MAG: type IV pilus twitching motility protein PilT [Aquificae bacterium]|nr:type IV pilus twitching motility protein PilT [Aquificota bacterium]